MTSSFHSRTSSRGTLGQVTINFEVTLNSEDVSPTGATVEKFRGEVERVLRAAATATCAELDAEARERIEAYRTALAGVDPEHRRELIARLGVDPNDFEPGPVLRTGDRLIR